MTKAEIKKLRLGVYRIFYKDHEYSLASVGQDEFGSKWFVAANWISGIPCFDWSNVSRVELIEYKDAD
jgi:hypothetical protein